MLTEDLDLSGFNPETVEAVAAAGGLIPIGKYHVRLEGCTDTQSKRTGNTGQELEYEILTGPFAGRKVKDTVWTPAGDGGPSDNRFVLVAHRLGLIRPKAGGKGYESVPGKSSFKDCLGAEVVIEVNHRTYKKDDGSEGKAANVTFGGIWRLDDKAVKDVPKAKVGGAGSPPATKPTKTPVSNL